MQPAREGVDPDGDEDLRRVRRPTGDALDGARLGFKTGQIELFDDAPDLACGVVVVDQALDIEGLEAKLLAVNGNIAGSGAGGRV